MALCNNVRRVLLKPTKGSASEVAVLVRPGGLHEREAALPMPPGAFRGFRLLQEYFAFPERFMFVDLHGLGEAEIASGEFELHIEFGELPDEMPPVSSANVLLDCVPVINLFPHDADPIRAQAGRTEYRIRAAGKNSEHYEAHTIESVSGRVRGAAKQEAYHPLFAYDTRDRSAAASTSYAATRRCNPTDPICTCGCTPATTSNGRSSTRSRSR